MCAKIGTALRARPDDDVLILARVDAYPVEGLDGALRRAERYLEAGADGIFVASLAVPEELARVGSRLKGAIQIAVVTERLMKVWPGPAELYDLGFSQIVYPHLVLRHMTDGIQAALGAIGDAAPGVRTSSEPIPTSLDLQRLQEILGASRWAGFERSPQDWTLRGEPGTRPAAESAA
jgi:methylisocitrate lyase